MKYVHTNLVSKDWKALASFYIQVFDCKLLLPQRDLSGDWLSKGTAVPNAHIKGAHLRLPGYGKNGPTLEIFQYDRMEEKGASLSNRRGFGHIAFEVNNVQEVVEKAMKFGAIPYGQIATKEISGLGTLTFVYIKDPEGNIIEIQNWGKMVDMPIQNDSQEVLLPTQNDVVVTTQENKDKPQEVINTEIPTLVEDNKDNSNKDNSNNNSNDSSNKNAAENNENKVEKDPNAPKTKRELLDELQRDLDNAKQNIIDAKRELKYTKEDAQFIAKKTAQSIQKDDVIPKDNQKTKEELLEELKKEMMLADDKMVINLNTNLTSESKNENKNTEQPVVKTDAPKTEMPKVPAQLKVEIKTADGLVKELVLDNISLVKATTEIAHNLRCFTNLTRPEEHNALFIEWIGKAYKADLVPLLQQYKTNQTKEQNENAWAMTPRLRDSLRHFIGKCQEEPEFILDLKINTLGLTAADFVLTYKDLLNIVLEAEAQGATYLRLHYSVE